MNYDRYIRCAIATVALAATAMLSSCSRDDSQNGAVPAKSNVSVGFRISLGEPASPSTRSVEYDDGKSTDYENYIDFRNYCVMFFDKSNRYLAAFKPTDIIPLEDNPLRSRLYEVIGKIDWSSDEPFPSDFKVVILANWHSYPSNPTVGQTTIDDICNCSESRYDYTAPFVLSADNAIPMYGVKLFEGVSFRADMLTYLGTIYMLRSMAKIEVKCPTKGWTIESVELHRYNRTGFCAPDKVYDESDYVEGEYYSDDSLDIHIVDGVADDGELSFEKLDDGRFVIYVPEYRNTTDGRSKAADASEIRVKFEERQDKDYVIDFKYYENPPANFAIGDWFDIRRNYYYKFSISKADEYDDNLKISIDVDPYDEYTLDPIFGVDK